MGYGATQVVEGQPRVSLPYGLFSVLTLRSVEDPHWANGIQWESLTCSPASSLADPDCDSELELFFRDMSDTGTAAPFVVYGSAKCGVPGGRTLQQGEEVAQAHLLANEEAQAEANLWAALAASATDVNSAGALAPQEALGVLEGWMGSVYGSLGVIHAPRQAATLWDDLSHSGGRLLSPLGTPIAAGSGYPGTSPAGAAPATGEQWVFASPALFGYRGSVFTNESIDREHNDYYAVAQRQYVIGFDPCGVAAVRVTVTS